MARRALILVFLVTTTGGCPDLTRSERRPEHRSGDDTVAPEAPSPVAPDPGDDGVDDAPQPAAAPRGAPGPAAPNPLKLRPGLRPGRPVPRQPLRARPVPGGRLPARPVPGRPAPARPAPARPPPSDVAPDGTER